MVGNIVKPKRNMDGVSGCTDCDAEGRSRKLNEGQHGADMTEAE